MPACRTPRQDDPTAGPPQEDEGVLPMTPKPVYLTAEGLEKLKAELNELVTVERPRVVPEPRMAGQGLGRTIGIVAGAAHAGRRVLQARPQGRQESR